MRQLKAVECSSYAVIQGTRVYAGMAGAVGCTDTAYLYSKRSIAEGAEGAADVTPRSCHFGLLGAYRINFPASVVQMYEAMKIFCRLASLLNSAIRTGSGEEGMDGFWKFHRHMMSIHQKRFMALSDTCALSDCARHRWLPLP